MRVVHTLALFFTRGKRPSSFPFLVSSRCFPRRLDRPSQQIPIPTTPTLFDAVSWIPALVSTVGEAVHAQFATRHQVTMSSTTRYLEEHPHLGPFRPSRLISGHQTLRRYDQNNLLYGITEPAPLLPIQGHSQAANRVAAEQMRALFNEDANKECVQSSPSMLLPSLYVSEELDEPATPENAAQESAQAEQTEEGDLQLTTNRGAYLEGDTVETHYGSAKEVDPKPIVHDPSTFANTPPIVRNPSRAWKVMLQSLGVGMQPILKWDFTEENGRGYIAHLTIALPPTHPSVADHPLFPILPKNPFVKEYVTAVSTIGATRRWSGESRGTKLEAQDATLVKCIIENALDWVIEPSLRS